MNKKRVLYIGILVLVVLGIFVGLNFFGGRNIQKSDLGNDNKSFRMGMILENGKDDSELSIAAYEAMESLTTELGAFVSLREKVQLSDLEAGLRQYATEGYELVYVHGAGFSEVVLKVATEFPKVSFVVLNDDVTNSSNVGSIRIDYRAIGFIKGVFAAYQTKNDVVAGVGMSEDLATRGELYGFQRGVAYVDPNVQVHMDYAEKQADSSAKKLALSFLSYGADVVLSVAGAEDQAVFEAAESKKAYGISGDAEFFGSFPSVVIASSSLDLLTVVVDLTNSVVEDRFTGKVIEVPFEFMYNDTLKARVTSSVLSKVQGVLDKIRSGELKMDVLAPWV